MVAGLPTKAEVIRVMGVILREVSRAPLSRTDLEKRVSQQGVSHACFEGIFRFLAEDGDVEKCGPEHRAHYRITEKGLKFLAWGGLT